MGDNPKPAKLDSNVWYHVTEGRVDNYDKKEFQSMLQILDVDKNNGDHLACFGNVNPAQYWQFMPVDPKNPARYAVRSSVRGVFKQLGTCYNAQDIDEQHTQPCLLRSDGSDTQKWDITLWPSNNGTFYRFQNVQNGTKYNMDVHPGSNPFMSNDVDGKNFQKAQHWLMTSASSIDDGAYSTTFTDVPVSTVTSAGTTQTLHSTSPTSIADSSSSSSLSSGAAAGIGIGVGLGVIALSIAAFLLWRRRKRSASRGDYALSMGESGSAHPDVKIEGTPTPPYYSAHDPAKNTAPSHEMMHNPAPQEVPGEMHYEMDATPAQGHQNHHPQ